MLIGLKNHISKARIGSRLNQKFIPEYIVVYNAMTVKPSSVIAEAQDNLVKTLVNGGVFSKLDWFNFRAIQGNSGGDAQLNWVNPTQKVELSATPPLYTLFSGFTGNGTSSYINTSFNPSIASKFSLNDACIFFYKSKIGASGKADLGVKSGNAIVNMATHVENVKTLAYNRLNNDNVNNSIIVEPAAFNGLWMLNRKDSASFDIWQNKVKMATKPVASTAIPDGIVWELAVNDTIPAYSTAEHILFGAGQSLTDIEIGILNDAIATYLVEIQRFDSILSNSINISEQAGFNIRNPFSEYEFYTTDDKILVKANPTIYGNFPAYAQVAVFEDDVYKAVYQFTTWDWKEITLSAGNKKVSLVEGLTTTGGGATIKGTFITDIRANHYTKISQSQVTSKTAFIGDSITVGGNSANPQKEAFARLFKVENSKEVAVLGYGYARLKDFAETTLKINDTVSKLVALLSNATEKKLVIALGTNDYGLDSTTAATFATWYANFVDAINVADSNIQIYCVSPIRRTGDPALLADYRTEINTICSTRVFATHINGYDILLLTDMADGVHPTTAGHKKYKDAIYPVIYPA